jgi:ubiquinone/menaquinone biosynthesis C-methylase UbiE
MQAYSQKFSLVYNMRWGRFAEKAAPQIMYFYEATPAGQNNKTLLDVCCGTGQLALHFAHMDDLQASLAEPEKESRVFVIAGK